MLIKPARTVTALLAAISLSCSSVPTLAQTASPGEVERALTVADDLSLAFEHAAAAVSPSVVNVRAVTRITTTTRPVPFQGFENSPFREFFGDDFFDRFAIPQPGRPGQPGNSYRQGQGSGFIVSGDGYILTNNHVVNNASHITIQLTNGAEHTAELVGADPSTDLALLKIDASGLTPVTFADSDDARVGSWVVAVGNPFGLESTITAGIVSAVGRSRMGIADYEDFIQTDAAINPGNSGGPLVNLRGEVVGVNTAIATRTGGAMGIGFAIPSNLAVSIMEDLRDDGAVRRGYLGVIIQDLDQGLAQSFNYDGDEGVLISQVQPDSPAEKAGLKPGDVITAFNGNPLRTIDQFRLRVASTNPGSTVEMTVHRDGLPRTVSIEIGELEGQKNPAAPAPSITDQLGLQLQNLDQPAARQLAIETTDGVLVTAVQPWTAGARAGLRPRDVITHVHDQRIRNLREFQRALDKHDLTQGVRLTVLTGDSQRFVFLRQTESAD